MDWWYDIQQGEEFQPPFRTPTCGAIFDDEDLYANHARWSIASYLIVRNDHFILNPHKWVDLSSHNLSQVDLMSFRPLLHSLHLWYYPPHMRDVRTYFKTAACGYTDLAECMDILNPTSGFKRMLDKLENRGNDRGTFLFWIRSGHCSRLFIRWPQHQEGKVRCSKVVWHIK